MIHKKSCGFPTHLLGTFTHRQSGLKHAEFSDVALKVRTNKKIESAITFCSLLHTGNMMLHNIETEKKKKKKSDKKVPFLKWCEKGLFTGKYVNLYV